VVLKSTGVVSYPCLCCCIMMPCVLQRRPTTPCTSRVVVEMGSGSSPLKNMKVPRCMSCWQVRQEPLDHAKLSAVAKSPGMQVHAVQLSTHGTLWHVSIGSSCRHSTASKTVEGVDAGTCCLGTSMTAPRLPGKAVGLELGVPPKDWSSACHKRSLHPELFSTWRQVCVACERMGHCMCSPTAGGW